MAEFNEFVEKLEKELTCSICEEVFTEPKQLHCLHSFCLKCIEMWNDSCKSRSKRFSCPTCRSHENNDVSELRASFYLDTMIQLLLAMKSRAGKTDDQIDEKLPGCESCNERVQLVAFCQQCQGMICADCVKAHEKMKQLYHKVIMFVDFKQEHLNSYINIKAYCVEQFHENEKLQYFCQTCQKCICAKCSNTTHGKHEKLSIEEKADTVKGIISNCLHRVNQKKQKFQQELELSMQNILRVENEIEATKKQLSDHIQARIKILKDHENIMINTLDGILCDQREINEEEQTHINIVIQQLDSVTSQVKDLQMQGIDYLILQSHELLDKCEKLLHRESVLSTKPLERNISVHYAANVKGNQTLKDHLGTIVVNIPDPSRCFVKLQNEEIRCGFVNEFEIVSRNSKGEVCHTNKGSVDVEIKDDNGCQVENKFIENEEEKNLVAYKACKPLPYEILVSIAGNVISSSTVKVRTLDPKAEFKPVKVIGEQANLNVPFSLAVNGRQMAAVVDKNDHRIVIFSKEGTCLRKFGGQGTEDGKLRFPYGVAFYDDTISVCDNPYKNCGRIQKFGVDGSYRETTCRQQAVHVFRMCASGDDIAVLSCHNVAGNKWQQVIKLFSKQSGQFIKDIPIFTAGNVKELPHFIASDNNKFFLSYPENNYIGIYDNNGSFLQKFGEKGKRDGQFDGVAGLAVYSEGMLLVCDSNNHRIQVFTQDGEFVMSFGNSKIPGKGKINSPIDIDVTPDGKVFILEENRKRIQIWQ